MISFNAFATSYCYDYADFKLIKLEEMLVKCSEDNLQVNSTEIDGVLGNDVAKIRAMSKKLTGWNPIGYKRRNLKALRKLEDYMDSIANSTDLKCMVGAQLYFAKVVSKEVKEAIRICSL